MIRNLIIKLFALDYIVKIGKRSSNFLRAANIIFPLSALVSVLVIEDSWEVPMFLILIAVFALIVSLFFGFIYFRYYPVTFDELDTSQKWQYGKNNYSALDSEELGEWHEIDQWRNTLVYSTSCVLLPNIIVFCLIIIYMFI